MKVSAEISVEVLVVAAVALEEADKKSLPTQQMTTTAFSESSAMQLQHRLRRPSRKWQSGTTLIRTVTRQRQQKLNLQRSLMLTRSSLTQRSVKYMITLEQKESMKHNSVKDSNNMAVVITTLVISSVVVAVASTSARAWESLRNK